MLNNQNQILGFIISAENLKVEHHYGRKEI